MSYTGAEIGFGRYRLVRRIAAGGMGEVYRALATGLGDVEKPVAIKLLKPELAKDRDFVRMFAEEAKVSFLLTHGNVVQTFDVGRIDDRYFIAMELVDGMTLATLLDRCQGGLGQPLPFRHALYVAAEALRGLDYAHRARDGSGRHLGVIHRDVSPTNLFVSREGEVKVGDFGIAISSLRSSRSRAGTVKGKLAYMAPEQLRGEPLDVRADVYAMGAVLYEMVTMSSPFLGSGMDLIPFILEGVFPRPRERMPEIPEALETIVLDAMAPDREARPGSAQILRERIEGFALQEGWPLSSSAFAEFVRRVDEQPQPVDEAGFAEALGAELRRVAGRPGDLSIFTSRADPPPATEVAADASLPVEAAAVAVAAPAVETADVGPPARRHPWLPLTAIVAGVVLAGGVAWFAVAGDDTGVGATGSPSTSVATSVPAFVPPVPPPETAQPPVPPVGSSAPATDLPATSAPPRGSTRPREPAGTAGLTVNSDPWAEVFLDGQSLGTTPIIGRRVPSGRHDLRLVHPPLGLQKRMTITLERDENRRIVIDLDPQ